MSLGGGVCDTCMHLLVVVFQYVQIYFRRQYQRCLVGDGPRLPAMNVKRMVSERVSNKGQILTTHYRALNDISGEAW